jgi:general secretion pathway protein I
VRSLERLAPPARREGFTLLEVLVALLIFGLAFGVLAQIFQTGFRQSSAAEEMSAATLLARSQLARIGIDVPLEIGETEDDVGDGFRVRTTIAPAGLATSDEDFVAVLVEVAVVWGPPPDERQVALTTLRLAAVPSEDRP